MGKINVYPLSLGQDQWGPSEFFSAFYPLGCLVAYAKVHEGGALNEAFAFEKVTPIQARQIPAALAAVPADEPAIFLFSNYVWNHAVNLDCAKEVKRRWPNALVIVGGPHVPRMPGPCKEYFAAHPYVDVAVRHEGEITLAEILAATAKSGVLRSELCRVDLSTVAGLTYRSNGDLVRTPDRARTKDLALYPSPYTTGEFDHWIEGRAYVPLETNRGCPYGCTFCDWGAATLSKIARMSPERVFGEIEFAGEKRLQIIGFCDANFGILPRDLDIVRHVIDVRDRFGYPQVVGYTNAKTAHPRLTEIIKTLHDAGLTQAAQISMQTTDERVLKNVDRANIRTSEYRKMIAFFHQEDIPAVSDMMIGLPGQTFETVKADLQFFFDHRVLAVVFATSVMPNAPMADEDYQRRFGITVDGHGMVESTYSFTRAEYGRMFDLCLAYKLFVKIGLLKYLLYFAQVEYGVKALDFIARWLEKAPAQPALYPMSHRIKADLMDRDYSGLVKDWLVLTWSDEQAKFLFDGLDAFYQEVIAFYEREHAVHIDGSALDAILSANRAVMPCKDKTFPCRIGLKHDVAAYFSALRKLPSLEAVTARYEPLARYGPGYLNLSSQEACVSYAHADTNLTYGVLELKSDLRV